MSLSTEKEKEKEMNIDESEGKSESEISMSLSHTTHTHDSQLKSEEHDDSTSYIATVASNPPASTSASTILTKDVIIDVDLGRDVEISRHQNPEPSSIGNGNGMEFDGQSPHEKENEKEKEDEHEHGKQHSDVAIAVDMDMDTVRSMDGVKGVDQDTYPKLKAELRDVVTTTVEAKTKHGHTHEHKGKRVFAPPSVDPAQYVDKNGMNGVSEMMQHVERTIRGTSTDGSTAQTMPYAPSHSHAHFHAPLPPPSSSMAMAMEMPSILGTQPRPSFPDSHYHIRDGRQYGNGNGTRSEQDHHRYRDRYRDSYRERDRDRYEDRRSQGPHHQSSTQHASTSHSQNQSHSNPSDPKAQPHTPTHTHAHWYRPAYCAGVLPFAIIHGMSYVLLGKDLKARRWSDFGGKSDPGEDMPIETAAREFFEESLGIIGTKEHIRELLQKAIVLRSVTYSGMTFYLFVLQIEYNPNFAKAFRLVRERVELLDKFGNVPNHLLDNWLGKTELSWWEAKDILKQTPVVLLRKDFHRNLNADRDTIYSYITSQQAGNENGKDGVGGLMLGEALPAHVTTGEGVALESGRKRRRTQREGEVEGEEGKGKGKQKKKRWTKREREKKKNEEREAQNGTKSESK